MSERLPIVLCCAEESEVALVAVVDVLHRDGFAPEVVPGVETDSALLTDAADRIQGAALFVLCQSEDLDRFQVRRLQGLFSARKGPFHRMVTVDVPPRQAVGMLPAVREAASKVAGGVGTYDEEDDGRYMRDVVMPTSVAAVPGAGVPEPPRRSRAAPRSAVLEPRGISEKALGLDGETEIVDPRDYGPTDASQVPEPDVLISTDPSTDELAQEAFDPTPSDGVPSEVAEDYPVVAGSGSNIESGGAARPVSWARSGPVEIERVVRPSKADPRAEEDTSPLPRASTPIDLAPLPPEEAAPPERKAGRILLLLLAAGGMATVVGMAVLHGTAPAGVGPGHQTVAQRGAPVRPAADETPAGSGPAAIHVVPTARGPAAVVEPPPPDPAVQAANGATTSTSATPGSTSGAESGAQTSDAAADGAGSGGPAVDSASGAAVAEPPPAAVDDPGTGHAPPPAVPPPPTAEPTAGLVDATIDAAIAGGRVKQVDQLLVLSVGGGTTTWDDAANRCRRRKFEGLRGWRLPSKSQLNKIRKAKALGGGSYWSRTVVGGDEVYALDAGSGRMNMWLKIEPNAKAVCVRKRP